MGPWLAAVLLALVAGCRPEPSASQKLVLAIQPTLAASEMLEKAKPLERYLEDQLEGTDVEVYVPLSQAGVIEAVRFGQADVAFMGAWPAQLAVQLADAGQVDVTVIAGDVSERLYRDALDNSRVLEQQGPLPSHGVVISKDLEEPLRSQVVTAIEGLSAPEYRELMRGFISGIFVGFRKTDANAHLGPFKSYLEKTGLSFTERISS
jgi:ABC-type phosphate/phosphonate transport system substrate-binding protein